MCAQLVDTTGVGEVEGQTVFAGWGKSDGRPHLASSALVLLRERLGISGEVVERAASIAAVDLPESRLSGSVLARLEAAGDRAVSTAHDDRVRHSAGKSYLDLLELRRGECAVACDAVAWPQDEAAVGELLRVCSEERVAVVAFGGGTSVVGGVTPLAGDCGAVLSLDLSRLSGVVDVDRQSEMALIAGGTTLVAADQLLAKHGFTLGHFPQSYEYASVGGCIATRSAGQASTGYGRIDDNVVALKCCTPAGVFDSLIVPASAAGPDLRELMVGSEGTFGVITRAAMRLHRLPAVRRYEGWLLPSFDAGLEALRTIAQSESQPTVARLSDSVETEVSIATAGLSHSMRRVAGKALQLLKRDSACLLITGYEGTAESASDRRKSVKRLLRRAGAWPIGQAVGNKWLHSRYEAPYLRDDLLDRGVFVETFETATVWSKLEQVYAALREAVSEGLAQLGTPPIVLCHISHIYPAGASLYFTVFAKRADSDPIGQWRVFKEVACAAIVAEGATLTHHHGIGSDHQPWLKHEVGLLGTELLASIKRTCDPARIMNPGKVIVAQTKKQCTTY